MRCSVVVAVLGIAASVAVADPLAEETLYLYIREGNAAMRAEGARQLAQRIAANNARAIELARLAVVSNDPKVRAPLIEAMIEAQLIDRPTAALVPTAAALETRIRQLLAKDKPTDLPVAKDCRLVGGTSRGATLACSLSRCRGSCMHETRTFTVTTGVRWRLDDDQRRTIDDGSCGDCMLVE